MATPTEQLETVKDLATRARVEPETVRKAIRADQLAARMLGRDYVIEKAAADAFVARQEARREEEAERVRGQLATLQERSRRLKKLTRKS